MIETYECALCKETFEKAWSDEEATEEFDDAFEGEDVADAAIVCDDCYKKVMP